MTLSLSFCFILNINAEDIRISKKEKRQLIKIFSGKIEKNNSSTKTDKVSDNNNARTETKTPSKTMTLSERKKRRQRAIDKLKNMTQKEREAFLQEMRKNRKAQSTK